MIANLITPDVPEYSVVGGGDTKIVYNNFDNGDIVLTCDMSANPAVTQYTFYNAGGGILQSSSSSAYTVTSAQGYGVYSCKAINAVGTSAIMYIDLREDTGERK